MAENIYEDDEITLKAIVQVGVSDAQDVEFIFYIDGEEKKREKGTFESTPAKAGDKASCTYKPPLVKDIDKTKDSYQLDCHFEYKVGEGTCTAWNFAKYVVWPKTGGLEVVWEKDDAAFKGYQFIVKQNGVQKTVRQNERDVGIIQTTMSKDTDGGVLADDKKIKTGSAEFALDKGYAFVIERESPFEIKEWVTETGLQRKLKGNVTYKAEFREPKITSGNSAGKKQFVNLGTNPPADKGLKGIGREATITVGVQGDLARSVKIGAPEKYVYLRATFSGDTTKALKKSSRADDDAKTEIKAELNFSDLKRYKEDGTTEDATKGPIFMGKVELKEVGGTGKFKVYLGLAGGDSCKIEISGTEDFIDTTKSGILADQTYTFTNWRKVWYEIQYPDIMKRELVARNITVRENNADVQKSFYDFPAKGREKLKALGDSIYVDFEFWRSNMFNADKSKVGVGYAIEAQNGTLLTKKFLYLNSGPGDADDPAFLLTDYTFPLLPQRNASDVDFDKTHNGNTIYFKICDANYYWERKTEVVAGVLQWKPKFGRKSYSDFAQGKKSTINCESDLSGYFIPVSGLGANAGGSGADSISAFKWMSSIDPASVHCQHKPTHTFEGNDRTAPEQLTAATLEVTVTETLQNETATVEIKPICEETTIEITDADAGKAGAAKTRTITVKEKNGRGNPVALKFTKPGTFSHIDQDVSDTDKGKIESFIKSLFDQDWLKDNDNKYAIEVEAESGGSSRQTTRIQNVKDAVNEKFTATKSTRVFKFDKELKDTEKTKIEDFMKGLVDTDDGTDGPARAKKLRQNKNKVKFKISARAGNTRDEDACFGKVKAEVESKFTSISKKIAFHPALDDDGVKRQGNLGMSNINMTESTCASIVIDLPDTNADDPGKFVGASDSTTKSKITIAFDFENHDEALGLCQDDQNLCVFNGQTDNKAKGSISTAMHEIGHSMGQAIYKDTTRHISQQDFAPKGMDFPKKVTEDLTEDSFKTNGTKGHQYVGKDHSGSHCAYGMSDADKGGASFRSKGGTCTMFGEGGNPDVVLCPQCIDNFRGANLIKLGKNKTGAAI